MLRVIHQKESIPRASSLYCRWIRENLKEGARLVAVWIDSDMRCFEREFAPSQGLELSQLEALEDPGGTWGCPSRIRTTLLQIATVLS